jgi:hypothetical protein
METEDFSPQARQGYGSFRQSNPQSDMLVTQPIKLATLSLIPFCILQLSAAKGLNLILSLTRVLSPE